MTSQRRVRRLARAAGVECVHPRPYVRTTLPDTQAREGGRSRFPAGRRGPAAGRRYHLFGSARGYVQSGLEAMPWALERTARRLLRVMVTLGDRWRGCAGFRRDG